MSPPGPLRPLLQDVRAYLSDQGDLHLEGLDVPKELLRRRLGAAPSAPSAPSSAPGAPVPAAGRPKLTGLPQLSDPSLQGVRDHLGNCVRCPLSASRTSIVFGVGDPKAQLMFVGEAPGRDEDLLGEPFVGEAGRLLDRMLHAMGVSRSTVYIANIIKCRPPQNRYPAPEEVAACSPFVLGQIRAIKPRAVVALGRLAAHTLLNTTVAISKLRGQWGEIDQIPLMPTFHPAYLLRAPKDKGLVWQDLQQVMAKLGMARPKS